MKVKILLFASFREKAGKSELIEEIEEGTTAREIWEELKKRYSLPILSEHVLMAINEEFAMEDTIVKDGDTIAFFPPVSGG
ncbi:MAG: molybdopterin converting factor subunit 1 [Acidobacteriota bacterium]